MDNIELGDIITVKKKHPCGSAEWEVLRVGADIRLKCLGCGHMLLLPRSKVSTMIRKVRRP
ncbi:DUF951 domain-containing protein [Oribacterium sp. P6A1]|uniref:DUF951 domain-containing protein n=1 Tax=Oribacterium sp. P6A1 TaxID=1410612 RepID=UPI0005691F18|nr:DUF951 domain-containing protein [Oribacterium sp. P6A1]